jgi:hypothetical protein
MIRNPRENRQDDGAESLNALLGNELAAVEAYDRAMACVEDQQVLADLEKIRDAHALAAELLRGQVLDRGARPAAGASPWGTVAAAVGGTTGAISLSTALWALCQGEEHAINEYENALEHDGLSGECLQLVRLELLPQKRRHLDELNRLMGGMK